MAKHPKGRSVFSVEPQRSLGRGWELCLPHQAERWAVVEVKYIRAARGAKRRAALTRCIASYPSQALAAHRCAQETAAHKPLLKPSLGARWAKTGRKIIARSCTEAEYEEITK